MGLLTLGRRAGGEADTTLAMATLSRKAVEVWRDG